MEETMSAVTVKETQFINPSETTSQNGSSVVFPAEETINKNKPWRYIIRRNVAYGGSDNENIPIHGSNYQAM